MSKTELHPKDYRYVVFSDEAAKFSFLTKSTAKSEETTSDKNGIAKTHRRIIAIPRKAWWYGAAAIFVIACALTVELQSPATTQQNSETIAFDTEKDTFDNPEDAMRCLEAAFNDISLAVNSTQNSLKEIEATLGASIKMSKNNNNI